MSMLPTATQTPVRPDAVYGPNDQPSAEDPAWKQLDPCPVCSSRPHDAPEGTNLNGDPHFVYEYCFKCGYRPALNTVVSQDEMRRQYDLFQQFVRDSIGTHPSLEAPSDPDVVAQMQAEMRQLQDELARYRAGSQVSTTPAQPFTPNTQPTIPDQPPSTPASQLPSTGPTSTTTDTAPEEGKAGS